MIRFHVLLSFQYWRRFFDFLFILQILVLVTVVLPLLLVLQRGPSAEALCDALGFEFLEKVKFTTPLNFFLLPHVFWITSSSSCSSFCLNASTTSRSCFSNMSFFACLWCISGCGEPGIRAVVGCTYQGECFGRGSAELQQQQQQEHRQLWRQ